ncbi:hypothetical protein, partial [Pseudomonas syringae group genomosp. 7]|uniref:hypothetical protein n=1 Tax=Pseudomonas syringae group genomosp. 7 TaxID=251699 RepID=UPI0037705D73
MGVWWGWVGFGWCFLSLCFCVLVLCWWWWWFVGVVVVVVIYGAMGATVVALCAVGIWGSIGSVAMGLLNAVVPASYLVDPER